MPSGRPDFARVVYCRCVEKDHEKERLAYLERYSNLTPLAHMTLKTFTTRRVNITSEQHDNLEQVLRIVEQFAHKPQGWLVLQGVNGCGKTHLGVAIGNYQLRQGRPVLFVSVADLLDHLRSTFSPDSQVSYDELFERVRNAPLLILDDLGEHAATSWAQEKLYQIVNHRYNARLPTVITTCLSLEQIEPRIASRMADPRVGIVFNIAVPDYRTDLRLSRDKGRENRRKSAA
ncbi:MAG: ATP-binding protein [Chloroflexi bacterium]|nr:ATP-binding protein [Chloroflexota bacterium]